MSSTFRTIRVTASAVHGITSHAHHPTGHHALGHDDQPQGHRHAVPVVHVHHVLVGGMMALDDPRRAVPARACRSSIREFFNSAHHAARPDHDLRRDHAGVRRLRELADPDDDRRARHGVRAHEQLELLAAAVRRRSLLIGSFFMPGGAPGARLDAVSRRSRCSRASAWTSRSSPSTSWARRRSWARSTSSPPSSTCARRA